MSKEAINSAAIELAASSFGDNLVEIAKELSAVDLTITVNPIEMTRASIEFGQRVIDACKPLKLLAGVDDDINPADVLAHAIRTRRDLADEIAGYAAPMADPLFKLHRLVTSWRKTLTDPLTATSQADEQTLAETIVAQEARAREIRDHAQAAADKDFDKRVEREAKKIEKKDGPDAAALFRDRAALNRPVVPAVRVAIPTGVTVTRNFDYELLDIAKVPTRFLMLNEKLVKEQIAITGLDSVEIFGGGVRVWETKPDSTVRREKRK